MSRITGSAASSAFRPAASPCRARSIRHGCSSPNWPRTPLTRSRDLSVRSGKSKFARLPAFARPSAGETAEEQQETYQTGEDRQHADAAHHARIAHFQADPIIAFVGVAGAHGENARHTDAASLIETARISAGGRCNRRQY